MYKLNGIDIRNYGASTAVKGERSALVGAFSLPRRTGETERNWFTEIEPFVDAADIELDGRSLKFTVWIHADTTADYRARLTAYKNACVACHTLSADYADFAVVLKDGLRVEEYLSQNRALVTATFWQQQVAIPSLTTQPSGGDGYLIDGFNMLADFGIRVSARMDNNSIARRIETSSTVPSTQTSCRDGRTVTLKCHMRGEGFADIYARMAQFHALCAAPGLRTLRFPDGAICTGYVREGFTAKAEHRTKVTFDFKLRVL